MPKFKEFKQDELAREIGPKTPKEERIFAIESLRVNTQSRIYMLMKHYNIDKKELAKRLDKSLEWVTQLFSEDSNPTLEDIALIFHAFDEECEISCDRINQLETNARDAALLKKQRVSCTFLGCTFYAPRCSKHIKEYNKARCNGMPPSGRHG